MERTLPALAALVAGVALTFCACSGGEGGSGPATTAPARGRPVVKPVTNIVPSEGGGDVPEATTAVCRECQAKLRNGQYAALATSMDHVASRPVSARSHRQPSTRAVALVCGGAAKTNLGLYREALRRLDAADRVRGYLPAEVRPGLLELMYHAELVSSTAVGDRAGVRAALTGLAKTGVNTGPYVKQACAIDPSLPECGTAPSGGTETPGTTTPTDTGPPTTGQPDTGQPDTGPPDTGPPVTEPPDTGPTSENGGTEGPGRNDGEPGPGENGPGDGGDNRPDNGDRPPQPAQS